MCDCLKINYSVCVHGNKGKYHPVQQCGSLMCFWKAMEFWRNKIYQALNTHTVLVSSVN